MLKKRILTYGYLLFLNLCLAQNTLDTHFLQISPWRASMAIGSGGIYLGGNLNTYFDRLMPLLPLAFKIHYHRHQVLFDMSGDLFFNHYLLKSLDDNGIIRPSGLPLTYTSGQAMYGYAILDKTKWRITPFLGRGVLEIIEIEPDLKTYPSTKNVLRRVNYHWVGGLSVDYKICKKIDLPPQERYGGELEQGIQFRLAATNVTYQSDLKGLVLVGSLSYQVLLGVVRRKNN
jgi:hypothetical protein